MSKSLPTRVSQSRLFFVDNLRVLLIALVFLVHLAITYGSPVGSWYYQEGLVSNADCHNIRCFSRTCSSFLYGAALSAFRLLYTAFLRPQRTQTIPKR